MDARDTRNLQADRPRRRATRAPLDGFARHDGGAAVEAPVPQVYRAQKAPKRIVFIDKGAPNWRRLADGTTPGVEVVTLDPRSDGLNQIADYLGARRARALAAVDIVAHGREGVIELGNGALSRANVGQRAAQLAEIGAAVRPGGELRLYSCYVAAGASGVAFLSAVAAATGLNTAAATHRVGSAAEGGSWSLDAGAGAGAVAADSPFTEAAMAQYPHALAANPATDVVSVISGGAADGVVYGTDNNGSNDGAATNPTYVNDPTLNTSLQQKGNGEEYDNSQIQLDPQAGVYFVLQEDQNGSGNQLLKGSLSQLQNPSTQQPLTPVPVDSNGADEVVGFQVDVADNVIFLTDVENDNGTPTDKFDVISLSGGPVQSFDIDSGQSNAQDHLQGMAVDPADHAAYFFATQSTTVQAGPDGKTTLSGGNGIQFTQSGFQAGNPTHSSQPGKVITTLSQNELFKATWTGSAASPGSLTLTPLPDGAIPTSDGQIESVAYDAANQTLYFDTDSVNGSSSGIYGYNLTTNAIKTVYMTNGAVDGVLKNLVIDPATNKYYVTTLNGSKGEIYVGSLNYNGGNPTAFIDVSDPGKGSALTNTAPNGLAIDNAPELTTSGSSVTANQDGSAVTVAGGGISITAYDANTGSYDTSPNLASATVSISSNFQSGDTLALPSADLIGTNISGTNISESYNSSTGVLTLSGVDSIAHYEAALAEVTFATTAGAGESPRTVTFAASDGLMSGSGADTVNVDVLPVIGDTGNTAKFYQGGAGTKLDGNISVSDGNGANITGATVTIGNALAGDGLSLPNQNGITGSYANGVLTLTGTASAAAYQAALQSVTYSYSGGDPTNGGADPTRTITWSVTDADNLTSASGSASTLDVYATPVVTAGATATAVSGGGGVVADSSLTLSDANGGTFVGATVTISGGAQSGDALTDNGVSNGNVLGNISVSVSGDTLTLSGTDTLAHYQTALDEVQFSTTSSNYAPRDLTWTVNDGAGGQTNDSEGASSTVDVTDPLTPGTVTASGGVAGTTDATLTATFTDGDAGSSFSGTIDWGDGDATPFTNSDVSGNSGSGFTLSATHLYAQAGMDNVSVTINDAYGNSTTETGSTTVDPSCYCQGTLILTDRGQVAVETLRLGDLLVAGDGGLKPVRWIGRHTVSRRFADPLRCWPIRIRAGALADNVPSGDLRVSPDHALLVDGVLIQAGALVNGTSIVRETEVAEAFVYYHVECDDHSLIFVEGALAETFVDNMDRMNFDNWAEFEALYPGGKTVEELPYPRAKVPRQVSARIRARLAERAKVVASAETIAA